jgi:hypothetical protein
MDNDNLLSRLNSELSVFEKAKLRDELIFYVNHLLLNDFNRLVQLLYMVDVNEEKLKGYLSENPGTDAAVLVADMMIGRQEQKLKNRQASKPDDSIPEDEKW